MARSRRRVLLRVSGVTILTPHAGVSSELPRMRQVLSQVRTARERIGRQQDVCRQLGFRAPSAWKDITRLATELELVLRRPSQAVRDWLVAVPKGPERAVAELDRVIGALTQLIAELERLSR